MKSHVLRPVFVVIGFLAVIFIARLIFVPSDFRAANGDYKYQWHRISNEDEWKNFKIKYKGREECGECHDEIYELITSSMHALIQCENCHGPMLEHPEEPELLAIDRSRALCLRCHAQLPYRPVMYSGLPDGPTELLMQDPDEHNTEFECVKCHDVHITDFKEDIEDYL